MSLGRESPPGALCPRPCWLCQPLQKNNVSGKCSQAFSCVKQFSSLAPPLLLSLHKYLWLSCQVLGGATSPVEAWAGGRESLKRPACPVFAHCPLPRSHKNLTHRRKEVAPQCFTGVRRCDSALQRKPKLGGNRRTDGPGEAALSAEAQSQWEEGQRGQSQPLLWPPGLRPTGWVSSPCPDTSGGKK